MVITMNTDKQDVLELLNRYLLIVDSKDEAAWVALFAEDGEFDKTPDLVKGKPGLAAFIKGWHASGITASIHHFMGTVAVDLNGDVATAQSYYWAAEVQSKPGIVVTGMFVDQLRKVDGVWKFQSRKHTIDPSFFVK